VGVYYFAYSIPKTKAAVAHGLMLKAQWEWLDSQMFQAALERHLTFADRLRGRMSGPH
jgi:hypothetical protein